jgi:hypothetical protein
VVVHAFQSVGLVVELRKTVSGAENDAKDLRHRKHEVEDLRQEKEYHGLCEMPQDTHHSESHTSEVAKSISYKYLRGEFVMLKETQSHENEGYDDSQRENVLRHSLWGHTNIDLNDIVQQDEACDDKTLTCLNSIDASIDID